MRPHRRSKQLGIFHLIALVARWPHPSWLAASTLVVLFYLPLLIAVVALGLGLILARLDAHGNDGDDA